MPFLDDANTQCSCGSAVDDKTEPSGQSNTRSSRDVNEVSTYYQSQGWTSDQQDAYKAMCNILDESLSDYGKPNPEEITHEYVEMCRKKSGSRGAG